MSEAKLYRVSDQWAERAFIDGRKYEAMYRLSVEDPDRFWAEQARRLDWVRPFTRVKNASFEYPDVSIKWFEDGALNVSANCIDRHLKDRADQVAIIWEGDDPAEHKQITYRELHGHVCRLANVLKARGVKRGDRVTIYMPMIPEAAYAMLACTRIGAIHSIVFGGFSPDSLANRIADCASEFLITADEGIRGGRPVPLKANTDKAIERAAAEGADVRQVPGGAPHRQSGDMKPGATSGTTRRSRRASADCAAEPMERGARCSSSTRRARPGKPKGVLHTTGGYLLWLRHDASIRLRLPRLATIYWCTADVGWVTGPLLHRLRPAGERRDHPDVRGRAELSHRLRASGRSSTSTAVNIFYTRRPAIRALMGAGDRACSEGSRGKPCASSAPSASRSIRRRGNGITAWSATAAAPLSIHGGRRKPAAS
jgi:acetyl-CoA synthetase